MTAKSKPTKALTDPAKEKEGAARKARLSLSPSLNAAAISQAFSIHGELDLGELVDALGERCKAVNDGDLKRVETMLISQAHSLDTMFASLARRGIKQEGLKQYEAHLKLALKAQSQCRATLETLAAIKNPPIFAKQANIAHGPQQVNNHTAADIARAEQVENKPIGAQSWQTAGLRNDGHGRQQPSGNGNRGNNPPARARRPERKAPALTLGRAVTGH